MTEKWLDDIQNSMANYETDEPAGLWDAIAQAEPAPRPRHRTTYRHYIAAACAAAAVVVGGIVLFDSNDAKLADKAKLTDNGLQPRNDGNTTSDGNTTPDGKLLVGIQTTVNRPASAIVSSTNRTEVNTAETIALTSENSIQEQTANSTDGNTDAIANKPTQQAKPSKPSQPNHYDDTPLPLPRKQHPSRMSLALYTGGTGAASSSMRSSNMLLMAAAPSSDCTVADDPRLGYVMSNATEDIVKEVKHHTPIRFGLNAAFHLTDRLALETGLTYTQLNSNLREGSERSYYEGTQRLHYVGIPLNVKYNIYTVGGLNIYTSAGTLVEQCVAGRKETYLIVNGQNAEHSEGTAGSTPTQLSFNAAAGVQYNFTPLIGIYAEPGVSYYVDDNSSLSTAYKEHPWNFNVNLGLRFNIK